MMNRVKEFFDDYDPARTCEHIEDQCEMFGFHQESKPLSMANYIPRSLFRFNEYLPDILAKDAD